MYQVIQYVIRCLCRWSMSLLCWKITAPGQDSTSSWHSSHRNPGGISWSQLGVQSTSPREKQFETGSFFLHREVLYLWHDKYLKHQQQKLEIIRVCRVMSVVGFCRIKLIKPEHCWFDLKALVAWREKGAWRGLWRLDLMDPLMVFMWTWKVLWLKFRTCLTCTCLVSIMQYFYFCHINRAGKSRRLRNSSLLRCSQTYSRKWRLFKKICWDVESICKICLSRLFFLFDKTV